MHNLIRTLNIGSMLVLSFLLVLVALTLSQKASADVNDCPVFSQSGNCNQGCSAWPPFYAGPECSIHGINCCDYDAYNVYCTYLTPGNICNVYYLEYLRKLNLLPVIRLLFLFVRSQNGKGDEQRHRFALEPCGRYRMQAMG